MTHSSSKPSFMQGVMVLARLHRGMAKEIATILGLKDDEILKKSRLEQNPFPLHLRLHNKSLHPTHTSISRNQAEQIISLVAPDDPEQQLYLRGLPGYPPPTMDNLIQSMVNEHPHLQLLTNKTFGEWFRFYREQRQCDGRYITRQDCVGSLDQTYLAKMENGEYSPPESTGHELLEKLGFSENDPKERLRKFCEKTTSLFQAYTERREKFGRALLLHIEDSKTIKRNSHHGGYSQQELAHALHISQTDLPSILNGTKVPTEIQVQAMLDLFNIDSEESFYGIIKRQSEYPTAVMPSRTPPTSNNREFGETVRCIREELGITQSWLGKKLGRDGSYVALLEDGRHARPLTDEDRNAVIEKLKLPDEQAFFQLAKHIEKVHQFRDQYFNACLVRAAEIKSLTEAVRSFRHLQHRPNQHHGSVTIRNYCDELGITELELYEQQATGALDSGVKEAFQAVEEYMANTLPTFRLDGAHLAPKVGKTRSSRRTSRHL